MPIRHIQIDAFPLVRYNVFLGSNLYRQHRRAYTCSESHWLPDRSFVQLQKRLHRQPRLLYLIDQQPFLDRFPLCMGIDKMTGFPSLVSFPWLPCCPSFVHPALEGFHNPIRIEIMQPGHLRSRSLLFFSTTISRCPIWQPSVFPLVPPIPFLYIIGK
jgi:hypothetical protein